MVARSSVTASPTRSTAPARRSPSTCGSTPCVAARRSPGRCSPRLGRESGVSRAAPGEGTGGRVEVIDRGADDALRARGYGVVGGSYRVGIDFVEPPPEPVWPPGTEVRAYRPGVDDEVFHGVLAEAFEGSPAMEVEAF